MAFFIPSYKGNWNPFYQDNLVIFINERVECNENENNYPLYHEIF